MTEVKRCDMSKEKADEHGFQYCTHNKDGKCTLPEIEIEFYRCYEEGTKPVCKSVVLRAHLRW